VRLEDSIPEPAGSQALGSDHLRDVVDELVTAPRASPGALAVGTCRVEPARGDVKQPVTPVRGPAD